MSKKPYCGSKSKIPKGKRLGTMKECKEMNQIRRYGLNQVDQRIRTMKPGTPIAKQLEALPMEIAKLTGRMTRLKKEYGRAKLSEARKDEIRQEHKKTVAKRRELSAKKIQLLKQAQ